MAAGPVSEENTSYAKSEVLCGLCRDPNLHFVEQVALKPPEVTINVEQQREYEQQLADAANAPLPDEDDDIAE